MGLTGFVPVATPTDLGVSRPDNVTVQVDPDGILSVAQFVLCNTVYSDDPSVKCLSLWDGTNNTPPPSGCFLPGFDDSGWTPPVSAGVGHEVWVENPPLTGNEYTLYRLKIPTPVGEVTSITISFAASWGVLGVFWNNNQLPLSNLGGSVDVGSADFDSSGETVLGVFAQNDDPVIAWIEFQITICTFNPPGPYVPPPPIPPGGTAATSACNVAGYISNVLIRSAIQQAITADQDGLSTLTYGALCAATIPGMSLSIPGLIFALAGLYSAITGGTLADFVTAAADDTLFENITCAIYAATSSDGGVTGANYATVLSNVAAVSYSSSDVLTAISAYLTTMGAVPLEQMQVFGALAAYDCSGCGGGTAAGPTGIGALPCVDCAQPGTSSNTGHQSTYKLLTDANGIITTLRVGPGITSNNLSYSGADLPIPGPADYAVALNVNTLALALIAPVGIPLYYVVLAWFSIRGHDGYYYTNLGIGGEVMWNRGAPSTGGVPPFAISEVVTEIANIDSSEYNNPNTPSGTTNGFYILDGTTGLYYPFAASQLGVPVSPNTTRGPVTIPMCPSAVGASLQGYEISPGSFVPFYFQEWNPGAISQNLVSGTTYFTGHAASIGPSPAISWAPNTGLGPTQVIQVINSNWQSYESWPSSKAVGTAGAGSNGTATLTYNIGG